MSLNRQSYLERLLLTIFSVCYSISALSLLVLTLYLLRSLDPLWLFLIALAFVVLAIAGFAYLFVLFSIPQRLAMRFDLIKNGISSGNIKSINDFSAILARFLVDFYNYAFFDVSYAAVQVKGGEVLFSDMEIETALSWKEIENQASLSEEAIISSKIRISGSGYYACILPIWFKGSYQGFLTVFMKQRPGKLKQRLLSDLENNFIDDQLVHIINPKT